MDGPSAFTGSKETGEWSVELHFEEDEARTKAYLTLRAGKRVLQTYGMARRNPVDPNLPRVGEDLAVSRALSKLAHDLLSDAVSQLEATTHLPGRNPGSVTVSSRRRRASTALGPGAQGSFATPDGHPSAELRR